MTSISRFLVATVVALFALCAQAVELPGPVVSMEWLGKNLSQVQVVEVRSDMGSLKRQPELTVDKKTGKKVVVDVGGRIPEARVIDMKTMRTSRKVGELTVQYMLPERADFEKAVQAAGIDAGQPIVLVPMGQAMEDIDDALRVYWQFKVYGENQVAVLDGGQAAWLLDGRETTQAAVTARVGNWKAGQEQLQSFADSPDVMNASQSGGQLVDARPAAQFYGLVKRDYVYNFGHVANAKLVSPDVLTRNSQGVAYFYPAKTYASLFTAAGVDPSKPAITYCNSGHLASGPWFILSEIVGNKQTRLYDGSMHQWTLEKRPTVAVTLN
jgi:thiosulfate/3-mercaptopyruvate sulfurtransferase